MLLSVFGKSCLTYVPPGHTTASVIQSCHLIFCCPLILLPSVFPSIRLFFSESFLLIRWSKSLSFILKIWPSKDQSGLISSRITVTCLLIHPRQETHHQCTCATWLGYCGGTSSKIGPPWMPTIGFHLSVPSALWYIGIFLLFTDWLSYAARSTPMHLPLITAGYSIRNFPHLSHVAAPLHGWLIWKNPADYQ